MHDNENDDSSTNDFMNNNNTQDAMHDGDESLDAVMKNNTNWMRL